MKVFWFTAALAAAVCLVALCFLLLGYRPAPQVTDFQLPTI